MPRYGDLDRLMEVIREHDYLLANRTNSIDRGMFTVGIQQAVDEQPTADVAPVVHAHFIDGECTDCGWFGDCVETPHYRYCPNCGAKMDGERRDDV